MSSITVFPILLALVVAFEGSSMAAEAVGKPPPIYDENADGTKQITDALTLARKENKRVLLQFGANWCGWCHKLHNLFQTNSAIAGRLKESYVVALIDVNKGHNAEVDNHYGNPTRHGLPVLVVLEPDGKMVTTKDTGELEDRDHHDPAKVLSFLEQWAPRKP